MYFCFVKQVKHNRLLLNSSTIYDVHTWRPPNEEGWLKFQLLTTENGGTGAASTSSAVGSSTPVKHRSAMYMFKYSKFEEMMQRLDYLLNQGNFI